MRRVVLVVIGLGVALWGLATLVPHTARAQHTASAAIAPAPNLDSVRLHAPTEVDAFYAARQGKLLWLASGKSRAHEVLKNLNAAWKQGLNPLSYHVEVIEAALKEDLSDDMRFKLDRIISDAVARYGQHMTGLRVSASSIGLRAQDWRDALTVAEALNGFAKSSNIGSAFRALQPKSELYSKLSDNLQTIAEKLQHGEGAWVVNPIKVTGKIYPGDRNAVIPKIRERLGLKPAQGFEPNLYDDKLAKAVMDFQIDHGTKGDAIIGPKTATALNQSLKDRYKQIIANMERIRWLDPSKPPRYVVVNIPAQTLWAVDRNRVEIEMPVAVGRKARPTNSFKALVTGVRFNPTWTVPPTIKKEDFLPELQKNGTLIGAHSDIKIYRGGERLDPATVDWASVTANDMHKFEMVQGAGDGNALGQIRILMPNQYNIYLHDTNTPSVFGRNDRAVSSGCIRLSDPKSMATFVLGHNKNWADDVIDKRVATGRTSEVAVDEKFPIYLLYQTTWLRDDGSVVFANDLYDEDARLFRALEQRGFVPVFAQKRAE